MQFTSLKSLTELVFQYGPFAFSILFLYSISRWAYRRYDDATKRTAPAASPEQIKAARLVYLVSFGCGIILVAVSVVWFLVHRPLYVFSGTISNLDHNMRVSSVALYFRDRPHGAVTENDIPLHDEEFVAVSDRPFWSGQKFSIDFAKNDEPRDQLQIDYDPDDGDSVFRPDFQNGKNVLIRVSGHSHASPPGQHFGWLQLPVVHAQESVPAKQQTSRIKRAPPMQQQSSQIGVQVAQWGLQEQTTLDRSVVDTLQDPWSSVGARIKALEGLKYANSDTLSTYLKTNDGPSPLVPTLLDLTRHSDRELAYEANAILGKADLDTYLVSELSGSNPKARKNAQVVLGHMDRAKADDVIADLKPSRRNVSVKNLALVPTNFPDGDRYYMEVGWDPRNENQTRCLGNFFATSLDVAGTREKETATLEGRNKRLIYSAYRDWVLAAAEKISACGGSVAYVRPSSRASAN